VNQIVTEKNTGTAAGRGVENQKYYGFSLVEVMISLVIFSFGMLAVFSMYFHSIKGNSYSKTQTVSVLRCQEKIEQLMLTPYNPESPHRDFMPGEHRVKSISGDYWITWNVEFPVYEGKKTDSILLIKNLRVSRENRKGNGVSFECIKIAGK